MKRGWETQWKGPVSGYDCKETLQKASSVIFC